MEYKKEQELSEDVNERKLNILKAKVTHSILSSCDDKPFLALDLDYTVNLRI